MFYDYIDYGLICRLVCLGSWWMGCCTAWGNFMVLVRLVMIGLCLALGGSLLRFECCILLEFCLTLIVVVVKCLVSLKKLVLVFCGSCVGYLGVGPYWRGTKRVC